MSSASSPKGLGLLVLNQSSSTKKYNTSGRHLQNASTLSGLLDNIESLPVTIRKGKSKVTTRVDKVEVIMTTTGDPEGRDTTKDRYTKGHSIAIPYTQGLGESIKNVCKRYGIWTHFKSNSTIKYILVKPKDKGPLDKKSGAIYWYQCGEHI